VSTSTEDVMSAALDLPDDDRLELVEALIASFQISDQFPFDDSWHETIQR
jgi:Putative addiction module component